MNMIKEEEYYSPEQCLKFRDVGVKQGISPVLWHKDKHYGWVLWKRNKHDISAFGDSHGYNRWVSALKKDELISKYLNMEKIYEG